jgi:hypothetical protein
MGNASNLFRHVPAMLNSEQLAIIALREMMTKKELCPLGPFFHSLGNALVQVDNTHVRRKVMKADGKKPSKYDGCGIPGSIEYP